MESLIDSLITDHPDQVANRDLFEPKFKQYFEDSIDEEYEDFAYLVQRGKIDFAMNMALELKVKGDTMLRPTGDTVMHLCAEYNQLQLFKNFMDEDFGGDPYCKNYADETPLHSAAREGKTKIIKFYCEEMKESMDLEVEMADGWTPLFYAAVNGYVHTVEYLYSKGARLGVVDRFGRTPLHWVARYNNNVVTKSLLELGIDHQIKDLEGKTAVEVAKDSQNFEVSNTIINFEKKVKAGKFYGKIPGDLNNY